MEATLTSSEVQAALGELQRLVRRLVEVREGFDRTAHAPDLAAARECAITLSTDVPEVRVFGTLDRVTEQELHDLLAAATPDVTLRASVSSLLDAMRRAPRLHRALAHVHPYSFAPVGSAAWEAYRASLRALRDRPLWGVPEPHVVPLGAVYVPHRYREKRREVRSRLGGAPGPMAERAQETDDDATPVEFDPVPRLKALVADTRSDRTPMVCVVGSPGSGKSTLATMFAAELAADPLLQPLLIRLRDVRPERDLFEEIAKVLAERELTEEARHELATVFARAPRLVLLLDGFDELIESSRAGLGSFFLRVDNLLRDHRVQGVVCFGRDTVFGRDDTALPDDARVFTLLPFDDAQATRWSERWSTATGQAFHWQRFASDEERDDESDDARAMRSLTHEPLTLRLLALLELEGIDARLGDGRVDLARVYHKVIHETCRRHQAERGDFTAAELRRLLRVIGYAVMQSGREVIRLDDLERALRALGLSLDTDKVESKATKLILAISQRISDRVERAWEFVHKSLGEYLAAEFLASEVAAMVAEERDEFGETHPRLDDGALSRRWIERFGPALVTPGVERFLCRMAGDWPAFIAKGVEQEPDRDLVRLSERLAKTYAVLLDETEAETTLATARAWGVRPSEVTGVALGNVFLVAGLRCAESTVFCPELQAPGRYVEAYHSMRRAVDLHAWVRINRRSGFRGIREGTDLSGFDLTFTCWDDVRAVRVSLVGVYLEFAEFRRAGFWDCNFFSAIMNGASWRDTRFVECWLANAAFLGAEIESLAFERCYFLGARFSSKFASQIKAEIMKVESNVMIANEDLNPRYTFSLYAPTLPADAPKAKAP